MSSIENILEQHNLHSAINPGEGSASGDGIHGGELVAVNSNLNFRSVDKKVIKRIEIETGTAVRFAAGILRFNDFSFILCTLYLRCSVGMNEENEIRMKQLSML